MCFIYEEAVGDVFAFGGGPVGSLFNLINGVKRNLIEINHIPSDVRQAWLFAENESAAGNAMFERYGLYGQGFVFVYYLDVVLMAWNSIGNDSP